MRIPAFERIRPHLVPLLAILFSSGAVFGSLLGHEFQNVDDQQYVILNPAVAGFTWLHIREAFSSFYVGNYAPVQMLSYMLDYTLWGMRPGGFLLSNLVIHTVNGLLVYRLFLLLHKSRTGAAVAAGIFLLHPVQVESVAWISQRKSLLAMFFFLIAWEGYCRFREAGSGRRSAAYAVSMISFVLALLSKSIAVILPVVLVIYDLCYPEVKRRIALTDKIPFVLAAGVVAAVTLYSQQPDVGQGGRVSELHGGSPLATLFTMMPVFCRYLGMLVWPANLSAEYNPPVFRSPDGTVIAAFFLLSAVVWGGWKLFRHDRRLGFWVVFFFVALLPVSQIVPLFTLMNDRYLYFPMIAAAFLGGNGAVTLLRRWPRFSVWLYLLIALPLLALSVTAYKRVAVWRDPVTLWSDAAAKVPDYSRIWGNLGHAYDAAGNRGAAIPAYRRGLELAPDDMQILYNSGTMYMLLGDNDQAYAILSKLLTLFPNHIMGLVSFGDTCVQRGDYAAAEKSYLHAHQLQPGAVDPLIKLGNMAVIANRLDESRNYYSRAEEITGGNPDIAYDLACVESMSGRVDAALAWLEKALERGYRDEYTLRTNQELALVRDDRRFEQVMEHYFRKQATK